MASSTLFSKKSIKTGSAEQGQGWIQDFLIGGSNLQWGGG